MNDREAFEAWIKSEKPKTNLQKRDGRYLFADAISSWKAWQAATATERERCAKVCIEWADAHSKDTGECTYGNCDFVAAAKDCANEIRKGE